MSIITIRLREIVGADGSRERTLHVFCPRRLSSVAPRQCAPCGYRCPPDASADATDGVEGPIAVAASLHAGAASSQHIVCLRDDVTATVARASTRGVRTVALPVVDADGALLGAIPRTELAAAAADPACANLPVSDLARPSYAVLESQHVDEAIGQMTAHHARFVPIIDDHEHVTGFLSDLDLLRWIARGAPRRWRTIG